MTDPTAKLWRIRPLEWGIRGQEYCAESHEGQWWVMQCRRSGLWHYAPPLSGWVPCDSLSDGKSKCEALYAERMARGLEPVEGVGVEEVMKMLDELVNRARIRGTDQQREYPTLDRRMAEIRSTLESAIRTLAGQERGNG